MSALCGVVAFAGVSSAVGCSDHFSAPPVEPPAAGDAGAAGSDASESPAGQAGAEAGTGSESGGAGSAGDAAAPQCNKDAECDDGLRCNGTEACVDGTCHAGTPSACANAATCVEDTRWAACAYPDASPWLVYTADEDTPGVEELYAVKESLIGVQEPIKINGPMPVIPGKAPHLFWQFWTDDGTWLVYGIALDELSNAIRWYGVRFEAGVPEAPVEITKGLPDGSFDVSYSPLGGGISPNGHSILLHQLDGDLYRVDLKAGGTSPPLKLNLNGEAVRIANWVLGGTAVAYTTSTQAFLVSADGVTLRAAFPGFASTLLMYPSADGSQLSFLDYATPDLYLAKAAPGEPIAKINHTNFDRFLDFRLSGDGRYVTYSASEQAAGSSEVYLIDVQQSSSWPRTTLLKDQKLSTGDSIGLWAPDSSYFVFFGDGHYPNTKDVYIYDVATHATRGLPYSIGTRDRLIDIGPKGFLISNQRAATDPVELLLLTSSGGETQLHKNTLSKPYKGAQVAPNGSGVMFCNGETNEDMYYVDLRDQFNQLIQLPGQGSNAHCYDAFAPDSKGFVYYRTASDGSRKLYWVDSAHQVLGTPVQVTRAGRATNWYWQRTQVKAQ